MYSQLISCLCEIQKPRRHFYGIPTWPSSSVTILKLFFSETHFYILRPLLLLLSSNYPYHLPFWFRRCCWGTYSSLLCFPSLFLYLYPTVWHKSVAVAIILWRRFFNISTLRTPVFRSDISHAPCQWKLNFCSKLLVIMSYKQDKERT